MLEVLNEQETQLLFEYERQIANGFIAVGHALEQIREQKLFRENGTWDGYCQTRWGYSGSRANQLISATKTAEMIERATGVLLVNERQVRALNHVDPELKTVVVKATEAFARSTGQPMTEGLIRRTAKVFEEAVNTGYVDIGSGANNPIVAAIATEEAEAVERQLAYIRENRKREPKQPEHNGDVPQLPTGKPVASSQVTVTVLHVALYQGDPVRSAEAIVTAMGRDDAYDIMREIARLMA